MNKYPVWKYLMVLAIVIIGLIYSSPNLYGRDPAIQISGAKGATADLAVLDKISKTMADNNIELKSSELDKDQVLIRFKDVDSQLKAQDLLRDVLGDGYISAISMVPDTPKWLESLGGSPMKLGLDLSGGVHFTMEVDMTTALNKSMETMVQDFRADLRGEKILYKTIRRVSGQDKVQVVMRTAELKDKAERFLKDRYRDYIFSDDRSNDLAFVVNLSDIKIKEIRTYMYEIYADELFKIIDIGEYVKSEI